MNRSRNGSNSASRSCWCTFIHWISCDPREADTLTSSDFLTLILVWWHNWAIFLRKMGKEPLWALPLYEKRILVPKNWRRWLEQQLASTGCHTVNFTLIFYALLNINFIFQFQFFRDFEFFGKFSVLRLKQLSWRIVLKSVIVLVPFSIDALILNSERIGSVGQSSSRRADSIVPWMDASLPLFVFRASAHVQLESEIHIRLGQLCAI